MNNFNIILFNRAINYTREIPSSTITENGAINISKYNCRNPSGTTFDTLGVEGYIFETLINSLKI